jgi:FtsH-binding integral membrane protein
LNVLLATAAFLMLIAMFVSRNARGVGGLLCATVFCYAVAVHTALTPDARYANPFRPFEIAMGVGFAALLAEKAKSRLAAGRSPTAMTGDGR